MTDGYLKDVSFLIVDDNDFDTQIISNILRAFGADKILTADDGNEGYNVFRAPRKMPFSTKFRPTMA